MIRRELTLVLVALQFLTRIPVPSFQHFDTAWLDRSAKYFPLVGACVGGICAVTFWATSLFWPPAIAALLAIAAGIVATGCFHEDGLADTADGLGGGLTRERRLEIMKDSRIGTYGAVALILTLALKTAALVPLDVATAAAGLIAGHAAARLATVVALASLPYAGAKVKPLATSLTHGELGVALILGLLPTLMLDPTCLLLALIGGAIPAIVLAVQAQRLIGGYTGDVLGAIEQVFETGFLLTIVAVGLHSH
jgi:adenosylcobinamide-GDP ribazoletransferase